MANILQIFLDNTMKVVIQRVKSASVSVDSELISTIGKGLLVFAGVGKEDTQKEADQVVNKVLKAKFWPDEDGGAVSQFTLYGKMKGNRPDFHDAADPDTARNLYDYFYKKMSSSYNSDKVKNGVFQAMMEVELKNDGPVGVDYRNEDAAVTIEINTKLPKKEPKEPKPNTGNGKDKDEEGKQINQTIEFTIPPELLA
ncbi:D-aminoacyl-tRNA deacylase [Penicillium atrosanguineum]|nr:D-aminoacyl-tRNA deacylase [Penicillium atrosanguineum]